MKVVVLNGQNHKGNTWNVTQLLVDELSNKSETVVEFQTNEIPPCIGCFYCFLKSEALCPHRLVVGPIIEAIEQAGIIIAESPNYCMGMSGQLKVLFDHMAYRWMSHRPHPSMKQKIGVAISTTAGMGAGKAAKDIARQMFWWGIAKTYRLAFAVASMSWAEVNENKRMKIEKQVKGIARRISKAYDKTKPGIKSRLIFNMMKSQQKGMSWNPTDRKHWESNGWI